jgi:SAM-dependent methyltransferase
MTHDHTNPPSGDALVDDLLAAAYALDSPDANRALYARWASTYDTGFIVDSRYRYHEHVAAVFATHCTDQLGPDDVIIDIGCGTGLAGLALRQHRPVTIDGLDISPEMLEQAAAKRHADTPVYRHLIEADLTRPLVIADHAYAAGLSVGTFTHGHVGPDALHHLLPIIRLGGRAAIGINAAHFVTAVFAEALDQLVSDGTITDLHIVDVPIYDGADMHDHDHYAHVVTFTIT